MQTQKELVSLHPAGGILNIDILSFQRLAYRIFEETGGSLYPVLEETGKSLVVKRVAQEKKKELTILGSTLVFPKRVIKTILVRRALFLRCQLRYISTGSRSPT